MAVHKLVLDNVFDEAIYTLFAIHCTVEDYRLAYLLNKYLGINLIRKEENLDFNKGKSSFSIFEWEDEKQLTTWSLVSNICKKEERNKRNTPNSLFALQEAITKTYNILPEHKAVNYFLKIDNQYPFSKEAYILNNINTVPQIVTAYSISVNQLKSKDNLIFS